MHKDLTVGSYADREIRGASFTMNGDEVETFTIVPGGNDVRLPAVTAIGRGVFVVGYEYDNDDTHRQLAGRYVTFQLPHQRPAGK